jgi:hypothetical protein
MDGGEASAKAKRHTKINASFGMSVVLLIGSENYTYAKGVIKADIFRLKD